MSTKAMKVLKILVALAVTGAVFVVIWEKIQIDTVPIPPPLLPADGIQIDTTLENHSQLPEGVDSL